MFAFIAKKKDEKKYTENRAGQGKSIKHKNIAFCKMQTTYKFYLEEINNNEFLCSRVRLCFFSAPMINI